MNRFSYAAILESGERVAGVISSVSRRDALRQLLTRGQHPISVTPVADGKLGLNRAVDAMIHRVSTGDLAVFTRQLASLLKAGLPLVEALSTLREQCENRRLSQIADQVAQIVSRDGTGLADALDSYPRVFSAVYRSLIRAGETGGNLVAVLQDLAKHLGQSARLRGQVIGAFIYPAFLLVLGVSAIFVLIAFVIPRFKELFASFGQNLPLPTQWLMAVSGFVGTWWWALLACVSASVVMTVLTMRRPASRRRVDRALLRTPVLGRMVLKLEIARFAHTLGTLLSGGVGILPALQTTARTARNLAVRETMPDVMGRVVGGDSLASAFHQAKLYPPLMVNLIRTGEQTGGLPEMLAELSAIYEEEAGRAVTGAVRLLEPALIIVMGGIIAAIVAAVMLPVFQANTMVQ